MVRAGTDPSGDVTDKLVAALDRAGAETGIDTLRLIDTAEEVVGKLCGDEDPSWDSAVAASSAVKKT